MCEQLYHGPKRFASLPQSLGRVPSPSQSVSWWHVVGTTTMRGGIWKRLVRVKTTTIQIDRVLVEGAEKHGNFVRSKMSTTEGVECQSRNMRALYFML